MYLNSSKNYSISIDFPKILKDYIKEIIRYKPKDIIDFSYKYFLCLENNLPLNSIFETNINNKFSINNEKNNNQKETISSSIENKGLKEITDMNKSNSNEINQTNNSNNITPRNTEDGNENNDSEVKVPISLEFQEIIKMKEEEEDNENKEKSISEKSVKYENESQKKEVKDFIDDLFS